MGLPYAAEPDRERLAGTRMTLPPLMGNDDDPDGYVPDEGLVDAVNVALLLRQPLLLTGEPGTGKTQLAHNVAHQLGLDKPLAFETKSTSVAKDLFYTFDSVARFRAAQVSNSNLRIGDFITFNALGLAIILANEPHDVSRYLPHEFLHPGKRQSVVLIDEVDKAPRDFPNDILNEVDRFFFRIPEAGSSAIAASAEYRPVLIITSNSERTLPDAFLRRCVFYRIPFPDEARLEKIILNRFTGRLAKGEPLMQGGVEFFLTLRSPALGLQRSPGTAELLNWLSAMLAFGCKAEESIKSQSRMARSCLYTLAKHVEDQQIVQNCFASYASR